MFWTAGLALLILPKLKGRSTIQRRIRAHPAPLLLQLENLPPVKVIYVIQNPFSIRSQCLDLPEIR